MAAGNLTESTTNLGAKVAGQVHPLYDLMRPTWAQLAHVREGTGGFIATDNNSYLVAHPREWLDHTTKVTETQTNADGSQTQVQRTQTNPTPSKPSAKLKARRKLARYENIASSILESKKSVLFREQPTRHIKNGGNSDALTAWWDNVDGNGTHIDDALPQWWDIAGTFGHTVLYLDKSGEASGDTAADQAQPFVRLYTPLDVLDWRRDDQGALVWIKFLEAVQEENTATVRGITTYRVRVVDDTSWSVYDYKTGKYINQGQHGFGTLPVVYLFARRRSILSDIGESVLGDPRNHIDLFNLTSELRELLRNQTFSFINLPLGTGPDAMTVESAQAMMGAQTGTMNVLFSAQPAGILTGDPGNVEAYQAEIARVKREIYREAGLAWESDTKDAEAAQSLELKREEMTVRVAQYADECQATEYALVEMWYRATFGGDVGPQTMKTDEVQIHYPEHFAQTPFKDVLDEASAAQTLGMPSLFLKALRKAMVTKFEGMANLDQQTLKEINDAIDTAPDDPTPQERMVQKMKLAEAAVKGGGKPPADNFGGKAA